MIQCRVRASAQAFTLLELIVALAIVSLLVSLSAPDFAELISRKRGTLVLRQLNQAIELARLHAITGNEIVTLCRSENGRECGGNWRNGVLVFADPDADRHLGEDQQPLRYFDFSEPHGEIYWRAFQNRQYLQFNALGFTRNQNGNFTFCPDSGDLQLARQLIVNRAGRTRVAIDSDGDGIAEDSRGRPLRC